MSSLVICRLGLRICSSARSARHCSSFSATRCPLVARCEGGVQKWKTEYGFVEGKKRFQLCFVRNSPEWKSRAGHSPKTRTRPKSASQGGVSGTPMVFQGICRLCLATHRRGRGSSRNVRHETRRTRSWEPAALSLGQPADRCNYAESA
jgi:hypothetical protein